MESCIEGYGPNISPLMVISDYPTADELKVGKVLVAGESGKLVSSYMKANGYSLEMCYKTSYIKCAIPGFNSKSSKQSQEALSKIKLLDDWDRILIEEIKRISPNSILALGELPLNFLTNEKKINRYRGSILNLSIHNRFLIDPEKYIRVVPTLHPRDIFPNPTTGVYVRLDYGKAIKQKDAAGKLIEPGTLRIIRNAEELAEYWTRARHGEFLVTDIETNQYNLAICASLCVDGKESVSFPLFDKTLGTGETAGIWRVYSDILKSPIPKINQNILYDWTVLQRLGFEIKNIVGDTMLLAHTIYPELPKGLDFLTSIYTDIPYYKDEGKEYDSSLHDFNRLLYYNAKDSLATWQVWKAQQADAEDLNVKSFYFNFVHKCFFHYKKVNDRGILIDPWVQNELLEKYENLLKLHSSELKQYYGKDLNIRSPKQVAEFIYEFLRCPVHTHKTPSGHDAFSTDETTLVNIYLNEIGDLSVRRILKQIILCRKIEKVLDILETPYHSDGRMRTSYNLGGTTTGRTSTSQSIGWFFKAEGKKLKRTKFGTAFQKLPKHDFEFEGESFGDDVRKMFIPTSGYEFFALDGKNAEGRVVCVLAEDWNSLKYIEDGNDLHKLTASWIYNKPLEFIKSNERDIGKMARHAGNLGQSGYGLSIQVYKSVKLCNEIMRKFHANAPNVREVFQKGIEDLLKKGSLINCFGRRRDFFGVTKQNLHETLKEAYSFIPQGSISDHFKQVSLDIEEAAPWAHHLAELHDGLFYEIPVGRREEFQDICLKATARKINFKECSLSRDFELHIPIEMEFSEENWFNMEKLKS